MLIAVVLDLSHVSRWHLQLLESLNAAGFKTVVQPTEHGPNNRSAAHLIQRLEQGLRPASAGLYAAKLPADVVAQYLTNADGPVELVIDLVTTDARYLARTLRPLFNGKPGEPVLNQAVLSGTAPELSLYDSASDSAWRIGQPAMEMPTRFSVSFDHVVSRLMEGLLKIVAQLAHDATPSNRVAKTICHARDHTVSRNTGSRDFMRFARRRLLDKADRVRRRLTRSSEHWSVAWRDVAADAPLSNPLNLDDYHVIKDDGARFFADPFIAARDGRRAIFVEELPDDLGHGVISCAEVLGNGQTSAFRHVLNTGSHLSYPFVFEDGGDLFMLPEMHSAGRVDLYRCDAFPFTWSRVATLIDEPLHDATLFCHDGLYWISAAQTAFRSSTWDSLSLYFSETLMGPWRPHAGNPVVIDCRGARPAGPTWTVDGTLFRPAQDCSDGYGGALIINQVSELDPQTFRESEVARLGFSDASGIAGPHTLMRHAGLEVIDFCVGRRRPGNTG